MIHVLIVDDDPMVAEFNKRYLEQVGGFQLVSVVSSAGAALHILEKQTVDLIFTRHLYAGEDWVGVVAVYSRNREESRCDFFITAASDMEKNSNGSAVWSGRLFN
ncbi:hypothetical protein GCM10020331_003620 [Ectobacillus funiculus]